MRCPKCGFEQQDGAIECGKCGVIIAKAMRADPPRPAAPKPVPVPDEGPASGADARPGTVALIGLALIALVGAAWWLNFPSATALPEGAYINQKHRFAFAPPPDWLQLTRENARQVFEQHRDRFPAEIREMVANPGFEVSYTRLASSAAEFSPSLNVVVMELKQDLPPLTESEREKAAATIFGELAKMLKTYQPGSSSIIEVDGIASLQLSGTASLDVVLEPSQPTMSEKGAFGLSHVTGHTPEVRKTFDLRSVQLFVPGKKRAYVVSYTAEAPAFGEVEATFGAVTASFRVMDRPPRFGRVLMGALNGGLIGGGIYLFIQFIGKLILVLGGRRA